MFKFLCCKASDVADKTTEFLAATHETVKSAANEFTQRQLKDALEGAEEQVSEAPDVLVSVVEVVLKDGVTMNSLTCFSLRGVQCMVRVAVRGTPAQMAGMVAAHHAGKLLDLVGHGEKAITGALGVAHMGLAGRVAASTADAKVQLAESAAAGHEFQTVDFEIVLDLEKMAGIEEVTAKVVAVTSSHETINKVMSVTTMQKYVEIAISRRASQQVTDWQRNTFTVERAKAKGGELVTAGVAKGSELASAAKTKGGELLPEVQVVETAKAKGSELLSAGLARGGKYVEVAKSKMER